MPVFFFDEFDAPCGGVALWLAVVVPRAHARRALLLRGRARPAEARRLHLRRRHGGDRRRALGARQPGRFPRRKGAGLREPPARLLRRGGSQRRSQASATLGAPVAGAAPARRGAQRDGSRCAQGAAAAPPRADRRAPRLAPPGRPLRPRSPVSLRRDRDEPDRAGATVASASSSSPRITSSPIHAVRGPLDAGPHPAGSVALSEFRRRSAEGRRGGQHRSGGRGRAEAPGRVEQVWVAVVNALWAEGATVAYGGTPTRWLTDLLQRELDRRPCRALSNKGPDAHRPLWRFRDPTDAPEGTKGLDLEPSPQRSRTEEASPGRGPERPRPPLGGGTPSRAFAGASASRRRPSGRFALCGKPADYNGRLLRHRRGGSCSRSRSASSVYVCGALGGAAAADRRAAWPGAAVDGETRWPHSTTLGRARRSDSWRKLGGALRPSRARQSTADTQEDLVAFLRAHAIGRPRAAA